MIPLVDLSRPILLVVDVVAWAVVHVATSYAAHRAPHRWFARDTWVTRPRRWERDGRLYEQLGIKRWKDRFPEAGGAFGGMSKRRLPDGRVDGLVRFAEECRRGEWAHIACAAGALLFFLWNPWWVAAVMVGYGVAVNAPFVAIQRYNRLRIGRALGRRTSRSTARSTSTPSAAARARNDEGTTGSSMP